MIGRSPSWRRSAWHDRDPWRAEFAARLCRIHVGKIVNQNLWPSNSVIMRLSSVDLKIKDCFERSGKKWVRIWPSRETLPPTFQ
jgi:hypothetical protein